MATGGNSKFATGVVSIVHPWSMAYANSMADNDQEILKIERYLDTLTFDASDVPHFFEWGPLDEIMADRAGLRRGDNPDLLRPEMYNNPDYMRKARAILYRARVLARRWGFVGMWFFDKQRMANWVVAYLLAAAHERVDIDLPYGVIEPSSGLFVNCRLAAAELAGAGARVPLTRLEVEFQPPPRPGEPAPKAPRDIGNRVCPPGVEVFVYADAQLQYRSPSVGQLETMVNAMQEGEMHADVFHHATARLGPLGASRSAPFVLPSTGLFDLLTQRRLLDAAIRRREMVEGTNAQPLVVISTQAVKITPDMERSIDQEARAMGAEMGSLLHHHSMRQTYTQDQWRAREAVMERLMNPATLDGVGGETGPKIPVSQMERMRTHVPHPFENRITLPDGVELAHARVPALTLEVEVLKENYRRDVAEVLGLGLAVLQAFNNGGRARSTGGGGGAAGGSANFASIFNGQQQESDLQQHLHHVIQTERNWMTSFFAVLYAKMMGPLDMALVDKMGSELLEQSVNRREAKLAARAMETALEKELSLVDDPVVMGKYREVVKTAGTRIERRRLKNSILYYRSLLEKMRVATNTTARLVFQPAATDRVARQLQILLEAFVDRGIIDEPQLQPFVDDVFGPGLKLKKNAVSPAQRDQLQLASQKNDADKALTDQKGQWDLKREREKAKFAKANKPPKKKAKRK